MKEQWTIGGRSARENVARAAAIQKRYFDEWMNTLVANNPPEIPQPKQTVRIPLIRRVRAIFHH